MRILLLSTCILVALSLKGQMQRNREIFPAFGNYQQRGWVIAPMLTYNVRPLKVYENRIFVGSDSAYDARFTGMSRVGVGLEIGRFQAIRNSWLVDYIDFTVGIKMLNGAERFEARLVDEALDNPYEPRGEGKYSYTYATASFNLTNARMLNRKLSLHNTLGFNADYRFAASSSYGNDDFQLQLNEPANFMLQVHYKFGVGMQVSPGLFFVPSIETPILTVHPYHDLKSSLYVFHSRYRPLLLRLTLLMLDAKADRKCPTNKRAKKHSESLFGSR